MRVTLHMKRPGITWMSCSANGNWVLCCLTSVDDPAPATECEMKMCCIYCAIYGFHCCHLMFTVLHRPMLWLVSGTGARRHAMRCIRLHMSVELQLLLLRWLGGYIVHPSPSCVTTG